MARPRKVNPRNSTSSIKISNKNKPEVKDLESSEASLPESALNNTGASSLGESFKEDLSESKNKESSEASLAEAASNNAGTSSLEEGVKEGRSESENEDSSEVSSAEAASNNAGTSSLEESVKEDRFESEKEDSSEVSLPESVLNNTGTASLEESVKEDRFESESQDSSQGSLPESVFEEKTPDNVGESDSFYARSNKSLRVGQSKLGVSKKTSLDENKPIYPIIEHNVTQALPVFGNYTLSNVTESWTGPITGGVLTVASLIAANSYVKKQLGVAISNAPVASNIVGRYSFAFLTMNHDRLIGIDKVATVRAEKIIDCSKSLIQQFAIVAKATDAVVDLAEVIYEPNAENFKELTMDLNDLHMLYSGANSYNVLIASGNAVYSAYQGEYEQAGEETATVLAALLLARMMGAADVNHPGTSLGLLGSLSLIALSGYNLYTSVMEYMSDAGSIKSKTAWKDFFKVLSNSSVKDLYDFSSLARKYEIEVNNFKLNAQLEQAKLSLNSREEFGENLYKHIYAPAIQAQYDLLNKVAKGELTQEAADVLMPKHLVIELEGRAYDHCVTKGSDNAYYCYNDNLKVIDKVVIGENTTDVDSLYY